MKKQNFKFFIITLILLSTLCLFHYLFQNKLEAFSVDDIGKMTDNVTKIGKVAEEVPTKVKNLEDKLEGKIAALDKKISGIEKAIPNTFKSVFTQLGDMFKNGLIDPLMVLFKAIGNVFVQLLKIIELIIAKIVSIPSCILLYLISSIFSGITNAICSFLPNRLINFISTIYTHTLGKIVKYIKDKTGITAYVYMCYGFNVDKEIASITGGFQDANKAFIKDFGNLDFSKIKV